MFERIKLGVVSAFRSKTTIIALLCVFICELILTFNLNTQAQLERDKYYTDYVGYYTNYYREFWGSSLHLSYAKNFLRMNDKDISLLDKKYDYLNESTHNAAESLKNENYQKFYQENIKANVVLTDTMVELQKNQKLKTDDDFFTNIEVVKRVKKEWGLPTITVEQPLFVFDKYWAPQYISQVVYSKEMLDRGINELYTPSYLNGNTALYQFISNLFPILILLITVLLFYNQLMNDRSAGTIKNRLVQPQKRIHYLTEKVIVNFITMGIVLLIPTIICNVFIAMLYGFETGNIPILAYPKGITSFTSLPNSLSGEAMPAMRTLGFTLFSGYPNYEDHAPHIAMEIMDFNVFMIFVVGMLLLFILFNVLLNQFITTLFNNPYYALIANFLIAFGCFGTVSISDTNVLGMWNPYSYANPIVNLSGTSYYTYAMGIVVLSVYCIGLFVLSSIALKRKDVA